MNILAKLGDERVADVHFDSERPIVDLADGRTICMERRRPRPGVQDPREWRFRTARRWGLRRSLGGLA
jgi:hypothetical protein